MNFSKTASYSVNVLSYMATHDRANMSAAFLHAKLGIPYPYLRRVLTNLKKSGFIHSIRGRRGGFAFSKQKEKISIADIIESTDGLATLFQCIMGFDVCPLNNQCTMHAKWNTARNSILEVLRETTLATIVNQTE